MSNKLSTNKISCANYDWLEAACVQAKKITIELLNSDNKKTVISGIPKTLQIEKIEGARTEVLKIEVSGAIQTFALDNLNPLKE